MKAARVALAQKEEIGLADKKRRGKRGVWSNNGFNGTVAASVLSPYNHACGEKYDALPARHFPKENRNAIVFGTSRKGQHCLSLKRRSFWAANTLLLSWFDAHKKRVVADSLADLRLSEERETQKRKE